MAAEEVSKPSATPQYPEMIFAAIAALNDKNGSNKPAISKYIESQYGDLPPGHETLLAHHLTKMKESGELVLVKNNYMRPDPDAPPRRGRGRPPKPKVAVPPGTVVSPPRPRGRPPKPKDPNAPPPAPAGPPRPRGRPPKKARSAGNASAGPPRPRGRPPKAKPPFAVVGFD
ncbi:HMG-Y-related protein B-like [Aristolochia californica]|uniref:HMG-Y-related protein B-like n=1 Tax=Aristolochia californica TaxID=171875 RepID=UPI0035D5D792